MALIFVKMLIETDRLEQINKDYSDLWYYFNQAIQEFNIEYKIRMFSMQYRIVSIDEITELLK